MGDLKKSLLSVLAGGLIAGSFSGCIGPRIELSPILHDDSKVIMKSHEEGYKINSCWNGKQRVYESAERNLVIFEGKELFEVDSRKMYRRFWMGNKADVLYREIYVVEYLDVNNDGKKEKVKSLKDYRFIDAKRK